MRRPLSIGTPLLIAIAASLAASPLYAGKYFDERRAPDVHVAPAEGHAVVYVFRPGLGGEGLRTWAFADDRLLMVSKERAYTAVQLPAGKHLFWSKAENTSALELELEAGRTYYLKLSMRPGFNLPRAKLKLVDETKARRYLDRCRFVRSTARAELRAAEIVGHRLDRAQRKADRRKRKAARRSGRGTL